MDFPFTIKSKIAKYTLIGVDRLGVGRISGRCASLSS